MCMYVCINVYVHLFVHTQAPMHIVGEGKGEDGEGWPKS